MASKLGVDAARIERLRDPARLENLNPDRLWEALPEPGDGATIVDIGAGVGYLSLPVARRFPDCHIVACDILDGMLSILDGLVEDAGLGNIRTLKMTETAAPLPGDSVDVVLMAQVHHELSDPAALLLDCHRLLRHGGRLGLIDWGERDDGKSPRKHRSVPEPVVRAQLDDAGFSGVQSHTFFPYHFFLSARR